MVLNRQTDDQVEIPSTIFDRERERTREMRDLLNLSQGWERDREKVERPSESESRKQKNSDL